MMRRLHSRCLRLTLGSHRLVGSAAAVFEKEPLSVWSVPSSTSRLQIVRPDLVREWAADRNSLIDLGTVLAGSPQVVTWRCKHGHEWAEAVNVRVARDEGCPVCAAIEAVEPFDEGESLRDTVPEVADIVDAAAERNGYLTSSMVAANSRYAVWFRSADGQEFQLPVRAVVADPRPPLTKLQEDVEVKRAVVARYEELMGVDGERERNAATTHRVPKPMGQRWEAEWIQKVTSKGYEGPALSALGEEDQFPATSVEVSSLPTWASPLPREQQHQVVSLNEERAMLTVRLQVLVDRAEQLMGPVPALEEVERGGPAAEYFADVKHALAPASPPATKQQPASSPRDPKPATKKADAKKSSGERNQNSTAKKRSMPMPPSASELHEAPKTDATPRADDRNDGQKRQQHRGGNSSSRFGGKHQQKGRYDNDSNRSDRGGRSERSERSAPPSRSRIQAPSPGDDAALRFDDPHDDGGAPIMNLPVDDFDTADIAAAGAWGDAVRDQKRRGAEGGGEAIGEVDARHRKQYRRQKHSEPRSSGGKPARSIHTAELIMDETAFDPKAAAAEASKKDVWAPAVDAASRPADAGAPRVMGKRRKRD